MTNPFLNKFKKPWLRNKSGVLIPSGVGGGSNNYLQDIIPATIADLDSTIEASTGDGTGQTWSNLIPTPADGSGQTDWDLFLGIDGTVETEDPAFTGTAGDSGAYYLMGSTERRGFNMKAIPSTLAKLHRTTGGTALTFIIAGEFIRGSGSQSIISNNVVGSTFHGFRLEFQATGAMRFRQTNGSSITNSTIAIGVAPVTLENKIIAVKVSYDTSVGTDNGYAINADTFTSFTVSSGASSTDSTSVASVGAGGPDLQATFFEDTSKIRAISMYDGFLSDADLALINAEYVTRHGDIY